MGLGLTIHRQSIQHANTPTSLAQLMHSLLGTEFNTASDAVHDPVCPLTYLKNKAKLSGAVLGKQLLQAVVNGWVHILQILQGGLMAHQLPVHTVCSCWETEMFYHLLTSCALNYW